MYDYSKASNPLGTELLPFIDDVPDDIPTTYPYVPRLCDQQGHMLIWYGNQESESDIATDCFNVKKEAQWITCKEDWKVEKAVALIWPYDDEVIIGAVKYPGYMKKRSPSQNRQMIKKVWKDLVKMFGTRKIICPSGTYLSCLHMYMNQMTISREPYHKQIMKRNGFKRNGDYWIRKATHAAETY